MFRVRLGKLFDILSARNAEKIHLLNVYKLETDYVDFEVLKITPL